MDFCGFILFGLLALQWVAGGIAIVVLFVKRSPMRRRWFGLWLGGAVVLMLLGRVLYQAYWLDERLFIAAAAGRTVEVKALLSDGASPRATWEGGQSALDAARSNGHEDVVEVLKAAGADR